jgi:large subunit ribosomal protein L9
MALEVLLRRNIEGVGEVGEIVKVRNGYARNFLLPQGYAALVNPDNLRRVAKDRQVEAVRQAELAAERASVAERLADLTLTIEARAGEDGHLYGSVGIRQVLAALSDQGFDFVDRQLRFDSVQELGEYTCTVVLSAEHQVPIRVWVVQDAAEARDLAEEAERRARLEEERPAGEPVPAELDLHDPGE